MEQNKHTYNPQTVASWLKGLLEETKMTHQELSKRTHIHFRTIGNTTRGVKVMYRNNIILVLNALFEDKERVKKELELYDFLTKKETE